ncbi:MAG: GlsB/YeaQ/YmgE family stress response membrane protein [Clostridiales bacterium]|nr:GlsB/YeaQ/YmgE family stress response membrane protein [Clostridiales bacterium]
MGILSWIIFGGLAGWIASLIMKTDKKMGLLANIAVGIVGAMIGGFLMSIINKTGVTGFNLYSFLVAVLGAVVLLFIIKAVGGKN